MTFRIFKNNIAAVSGEKGATCVNCFGGSNGIPGPPGPPGPSGYPGNCSFQDIVLNQMF